jgi:hypothetical protein
VEEDHARDEYGNYRQIKYLPPISHKYYQFLVNYINSQILCSLVAHLRMERAFFNDISFLVA